MLESAARDEIDRLAKQFEAELIEFRRGVHRYPELGHDEHVTTAAIVARLVVAGLEPRILASGTGAVCDIVVNDQSPTIGLRCDLDALPLDDAKDVPYRSQRDGICHACGHDAHTAVVLGAALVLAELAEAGLLTRSVRLIFQPAEELSPGGALSVIADNALDGLEQIFALHCDPKLTVGQLGFRAGAITAGADRIKVTVRGPGGHTARPHMSADVVYALGTVVTGLPAALSRLVDPRAGLVAVFGQIHAGAAANAIPQVGFAEGTIRCLDFGVWESIHEIMPDLVRALVSPYGVDVDVDVHKSVPPCVNDTAATELIRSVALEQFGSDAVTQTEQSLGGEDFAWMIARVPGSLVRLGVRGHDLADAGDLHRGTFDIDEAAISVGVRLLSAVAAHDLAS